MYFDATIYYDIMFVKTNPNMCSVYPRCKYT